ncbi:MAG: hypothetical protein EOO20_22220, partial [Chryseobacterium sp.]
MKKLSIVVWILASISLSGYAQEEGGSVNQIITSIKGEPDWKKIKDAWKKKSDIKNTDSIVHMAMVEYYWRKKEYPRYIKEYISFLQHSNQIANSNVKNAAAWRIFDYASDSVDLEIAFKWISQVQNENPSNAYILDTYANILYKRGKIKQALKVQKIAVNDRRYGGVFIANYFKMMASLPTWKYPITTFTRIENAEEQIWRTITHEISRDVDSLIWQARLKESQSLEDKTMRSDIVIRYVNEFKPKREAAQLNEHAWTVFECSNKKSELNTAHLRDVAFSSNISTACC